MLAPDPDVRLAVPPSESLARRLLLANLLTLLAPIRAAGLVALAECEAVVAEAVLRAEIAVGLRRRFDTAERLLDPLALVLIADTAPDALRLEAARLDAALRGTMMRSVWCLDPLRPIARTHHRHGESWLAQEHGPADLIHDPLLGRAIPVAEVYRDIA